MSVYLSSERQQNRMPYRTRIARWWSFYCCCWNWMSTSIPLAAITARMATLLPSLQVFLCLWLCLVEPSPITSKPVAGFIDPWLWDKVNSGIGLSYRHARLHGWRAGTTSLCRSWLEIYEFGYWSASRIVLPKLVAMRKEADWSPRNLDKLV